MNIMGSDVITVRTGDYKFSSYLDYMHYMYDKKEVLTTPTLNWYFKAVLITRDLMSSIIKSKIRLRRVF